MDVSIHALLAECDSIPPEMLKQSWKFQSTHSLRSATDKPRNNKPNNNVSIHALLAECDRRRESFYWQPSRFNPRTPCGVRPDGSRVKVFLKGFQSTHSLRSATMTQSLRLILKWCFNPRTPCGVRHWGTTPPTSLILFQSTHSLRSATKFKEGDEVICRVSIHALLAECDRFRRLVTCPVCGFNPRTPCGVRQTTNTR